MADMSYRKNEQGAVSGLLVAVIALTVLVMGIGSFAIWAYVAYNEAQSNLDGKIQIAVAQAKQDQSEVDDKKAAELAKSPYKKFKAPDEYCGLSFTYPQTWNEFWSEKITNGGDFKAYLNPGHVPPLSNSEKFALRVTIEQKDYDKVLAQYNNLIQSGKLTQSNGSSGGQNYARLTGDFSSDIRGDAVIYRCRDKTITLRTDADTAFRDDFNALIRTVAFNA